jgi:hypothetical protein
MAAPENAGLGSGSSSFHDVFSTNETSFASLARVAGWRQERHAHATHGVPPGNRQGGPWGSKT